MNKKNTTAPQWTVYYDGPCVLCQRSIRFIARRDKRKRFLFVPLQSEKGRAIAQSLGLDAEQGSSLILDDGTSLHTRSGGALRIARHLDGAWPLLYLFMIVPPFLRDAVYNVIARYRTRWFGRDETCPLPSQEKEEPRQDRRGSP